jgi:hypothetical protein
MNNLCYETLSGWKFWRAAQWARREQCRTSNDVQTIGASALAQLGLGGLIFRDHNV